MEVKILEERGYNSALYGFSLSYKDRAIPPNDWWCLDNTNCNEDSCKYCEIGERILRIISTAGANAGRGKGHNKFLRQMMLWIDIEAPRYWWSEMDTYKVGTVAQSESTMHTLSKRDLTQDDFENGFSLTFFDLRGFNAMRRGDTIATVTIQDLKAELPESYLQRRVLSCNYETVRNIIAQRKNHRLPEWATFIDEIMCQVEHPEYLEDLI